MKNQLRNAVVAALMGLTLPAVAAHHENDEATFSFKHLDSYKEQCPDEACAEISAYDPRTGHIFVTNSEANQLRILAWKNGKLEAVSAVDLSPYGGGPNSVAVADGKVAVAIEAEVKQENGTVELFDTDGKHLQSISAGALPDMLTFTADGKYLLVANEGEPNDAYDVDPEGSVSVISTADWSIRHADFKAFNNNAPEGLRVFGPGASLAQDLEPEYITVAADSKTAWVSLQENNALAKLDIAEAKITDIYNLGLKDHSQADNALDASNKDGGINIKTWPVYGMYMPDAIASYSAEGKTYILTANEGDARDYDGYSEEVRVKDLVLDTEVFSDAETLQRDEYLGRLKTTTANGDDNRDGFHERIYTYGGRSFSIWNEEGELVFDSGADFEQRLAKMEDEGMSVWVENRSDDKGPEPESVTTGELGGATYAFIGLERVSGIFVYQINDPKNPSYAGFIPVKEFGDESPEGLMFIAQDDDSGLLIVTNEVSNTTSVYEVKSL